MVIFPTLTGAKPKIIAHRGASGYMPEHTLEGYALAIDLGADYIEPDLVFTRDGHLVVRHDVYLSASTNISEIPSFQKRKRHSKRFGISDWFVGDFTYKEIKTLKARQAFPGRSKDYDDKFSIPAFADVLRLAHEKSKQKGRPVGVYLETKKPAYYRKRGLDFAPVILNALKDFNLDRAVDQVVIQSFDPRILMRLLKMTELPLILLLKEDFKWPILMPLIARFAAGIGPAKKLLVRDGKSTGLLERAHQAGLQVHPYTFRNDAVGEGFKDIEAELAFYFKLGVDALFTDFTDTAVKVRKSLG